MNEKQDKHIIDILFVVALFGLFVLSAVFLISIGANIYTKTMSNMDQNFNSRTAVAYINEKIRQSDKAGCISIGSFDGNDAIIISTCINNKEYLTYIYEYNGTLMELMKRPEINLTPAAGQKLIDVNSFQIDRINDNLVHISLKLADDDDYDFNISIHSEGGDGNV